MTWLSLIMAVSASAPSWAASGPDVVVHDLFDVATWGARRNVTAFSVGTTSCNVGDTPALWIRATNEHPVIAQNMYRLLDGRFEQIGQSWLKHSFNATNQDGCGVCDYFPIPMGSKLGPDCSDPYSSFLNGRREPQPPESGGGGGIGPRSEVNPVTGDFPYPYLFSPPIRNELDRRLLVHNEDLDPELNPGALYFVEGHYITADDAAAGNDDNNASYRRIDVRQSNGKYSIALTPGKFTQRQRAAIMAWPDHEQGVSVKPIDVDGDGRFLVGYRAASIGNGVWRYHYAIQNYNSHRAAWRFQVPVPPDVRISNVGFHDVDSHTGDGEQGGEYSNEDWSVEVLPDAVVWKAVPYDEDVNANALRWGTLYSFRIDADAAPGLSDASIGLFRPGVPDAVSVPVSAPGGVGGIPCQAIRKLKGSCRPGGTVKAVVRFRTPDYEGQSVTLAVDGRPFQVTVEGKAARLHVCCYNGPTEIRLVLPYECEDPIEVNCPEAP
ncbi:MAG: hypothetical protein C4547_10950 [Phycisphaerales bacterium]|nr:MAG: hypothetical protein C4547_10950 [Phycisphaerales bacterium]